MSRNQATIAEPPRPKSRPRTSRSPTPPPLDGKGPLWQQVRRALAGPIVKGAWTPGTRVPTETILTRAYHTSRMTVGKAIQSLASEGLVQRRRKIGTIVAERPLERPVFEIWDIADIVPRSGGTYRYQLLERRKLDHDPLRRELLGVSTRTAVLLVRCLHLSDDKPLQFEERLINIEAAPGIMSQPLDTQSPGHWLLAHVPWTDAEHRISAREAPEEIARQLDVQPLSACLVVDRRTWNNGAPVTFARLWHVGTSHNLVGHFKPSP